MVELFGLLGQAVSQDGGMEGGMDGWMDGWRADELPHSQNEYMIRKKEREGGGDKLPTALKMKK